MFVDYIHACLCLLNMEVSYEQIFRFYNACHAMMTGGEPSPVSLKDAGCSSASRRGADRQQDRFAMLARFSKLSVDIELRYIIYEIIVTCTKKTGYFKMIRRFMRNIPVTRSGRFFIPITGNVLTRGFNYFLSLFFC